MSKNIFNYYKLLKIYNKSSQTSFIQWLLDKRYISLQEYHNLLEIYDIYTFKKSNPYDNLSYKIIKNKSVNKHNLVEILETAGFVFPL